MNGFWVRQPWSYLNNALNSCRKTLTYRGDHFPGRHKAQDGYTVRMKRRERMFTKILWLLFFIVLVSGCSNEKALHEKTEGVPADAVWVCGVDGGIWIDCVSKDNEKYDCEIYNDSTGELLAAGTYFLRKVVLDETEDVPDFRSVPHLPLDFRYKMWDGDIIYLDYGFALVPNGEIDFPAGNEHGEKQFYKFGIPVGKAKPY